ncbi:MAG: MipA/OmpV family protein [Giesbergeria sp.]|nr:MipA/OmpV family protein [Giesbergeria sp.]
MTCNCSLSLSLPRCAAALLGVALAWPVLAQDAATAATAATAPTAPTATAAPEEKSLKYVLGVAYGWSPTYAGSARHKSSFSPVLSLQYGRFRLSSSRGNAVLNHGFDDRGSGASATLVERERFNLSASLRIDNGRDDGDDRVLRGLPEIRSTLRGRVSAGYVLSERWSVNAGVSQDLLGREGGAQLNTSLRYAFDLTPATKVGVNMGAALGDGTYMRSHFGVPVSAAASSPLAAFKPRGGLYGVDLGVDMMTALNPRWVAFASAGVSQLQGDARRSPLTQRATNYGVSVGVAYRYGR